MVDGEKNYSVRSVDRAIDVLMALAGADGPLSLTQLAAAADGSKSAIFSTLQTLLARGFVLSAGSGLERRYQLGLELARLGDVAMQRFSFGPLARETLEGLSQETGLTSRAAVLEGRRAVSVGRVNGRSSVRFDLRLGQRELLHSSSVGKAILATCSDDEVRELLGPEPWEKHTDRTISSARELLPELQKTRARGFSLDDEEDADGILCIGAPVVDRYGRCHGAISVTRIKGDIRGAQVAELGEKVALYAKRLASTLAGAEPQSVFGTAEH